MNTQTPVEKFAAALPGAIAKVFSTQSGTWSLAVDASIQPLPARAQIVTLLLIAEPSKSEAALSIPLESAVALAGLPPELAAANLEPDKQESIRSVFAKACETAAQVLGGLQVHVRQGTPSWQPANTFSLSGSDGGSKRLQIQIQFSPDWPGTPTRQEKAVTSSATGTNIALLQDVALEVTLRFGQRQLSLREIGDLHSGSVVELDKSVQDPAELLLGNRVVARGEVVIVDGNYGLRVTEVVS